MRPYAQDDAEIIDGLRCGRGEALALLFDRYGRMVFLVASRILHDQAEAEDLMQEVFLEVYRKAHQYESARGSVKTWLLQYAYHRAFNRRKYLALRRFYDDDPTLELAEQELTNENHGLTAVTCSQDRRMIEQGLENLQPRERRIIGLVLFDALTLREASERLNETYVNGRNLYYRGLKKLRSFLSGKEVNCERT
jgi:RNA polymerase sigma-70 factor, ECF subfamily